MKEIRELKLEELTPLQKVGMSACFCMYNFGDGYDYLLDLIKNHACGAVWVLPQIQEKYHVIEMVKEAADYPILILTDAESGLGDYMIGLHNSLGMTDSEELAYSFGRVTAITARKMGYNMVCNPLVDMIDSSGVCGKNIRSLGSDKHRVSALAAAIARGMHDGGVLTCGKHYPGSQRRTPAESAKRDRAIDTHMAEGIGIETREELIETTLYPYRKLMEEDLLDAIMVEHKRYVNIDPENPATLSPKVLSIIRELGFDGVAVTDALSMGGIVSKYGQKGARGLPVARGNDLALVWGETKFCHEAMVEYYENGMIPDERLDEAVRRILDAQHKVLALSQDAEITEEDMANIHKINTDSIYAKTNEGVSVAIDREARHLFMILTDNSDNIDAEKVIEDTQFKGWYNPGAIAKRVKELFPNSGVHLIHQFPTPLENGKACIAARDYDDVIFITFFGEDCSAGFECFTPRILSVMDAMLVSKQLSTVVHFGNPYVLEYLHHVERILVGSVSSECVDTALTVLAGEYPAKGKLTYNVDFE